MDILQLFLFISLALASSGDLIAEVTTTVTRMIKYMHGLLLQKYRDDDVLFVHKTNIQFLEVEGLGWPDSVVFYGTGNWSETDEQAILVNMDQIRFIPDFRVSQRS